MRTRKAATKVASAIASAAPLAAGAAGAGLRPRAPASLWMAVLFLVRVVVLPWVLRYRYLMGR